MIDTTRIELSCAREIPFKAEIVPFLTKTFQDGISRLIPKNTLLQKQPMIMDALRGQPLYVRISCPKLGRCIDPKFTRALKSFFKRDVVVEMYVKKGEVTLVLF